MCDRQFNEKSGTPFAGMRYTPQEVVHPNPRWGLRRLYTAWKMVGALFPALMDLKPRMVPLSRLRKFLLTMKGPPSWLTSVPGDHPEVQSMRGEGGEGPVRQDTRLPVLRAGDGQGPERNSQHPRKGTRDRAGTARIQACGGRGLYPVGASPSDESGSPPRLGGG